MNKSINHRKDTRTKKQFAQDIKFRTAKEKFLVELFIKEYNHLGIYMQVQNYGIDNTGRLTQKSNCKPDYKMTYKNQDYLVEIKNSPVSHKWTFKVYHLQQYIKQNAYLLVFWGTGNINTDVSQINYNTTRFGTIVPNKIKLMLKKYKHYREPTFGNKVCIQIPSEDFNKFCTPLELTHVKRI